MEGIDEKILREMVAKDYVIFAPKSDRDLRKDYPELWDYEELKKLTPSEIRFVWWYSCKSSPIEHLPEEKRFPIAIEQSFEKTQRRERMERWCPSGGAPKFPDEIKSAIRTMERFNPGSRIQMAADNAYLFRECQAHIRQERRADQKDREEYLKVAALARKLMAEIKADVERGNHGVEEVQNTTLANLEGVSTAFIKSRA